VESRLNKHIRQGALASVIAALYAALTLLLAPISYGEIQLRVAEALCVLPLFTPAAIPGLFVGCLLANLLGGNGPWDVALGSLTTLAAAFLTWRLRKAHLAVALAPPVLFNAVVVGAMLGALYIPDVPIPMLMLSVGLGQFAAVYLFGWLLVRAIRKTGMEAKLGK
jgi:uncharacterized membrane protein